MIAFLSGPLISNAYRVTSTTSTNLLYRKPCRVYPTGYKASGKPAYVNQLKMGTAGEQAREQLVLYGKAGPTGTELGDCPFTGKLHMGIRLKQLPVQLVYIDTKNKPDWYLKLNPNGTVPTLKYGKHADDIRNMHQDDTIFTDSELSLQFLDDQFASRPPKLQVENAMAQDLVGKIFPTFATYLKFKGDDKDNEDFLKLDLDNALIDLDEYLKRSGMKFLCGDEPSGLDCNLVHKLYHVRVAGDYYKNFAIPHECKAVHAYMERAEALEAFQKSKYPESVVIWGWSKFFE
eukprot:CAMPEP_0184699684 /NCGR_PEP_ID=MMETSP0313-20130426/5866_1 /TAXON_ID=2792 /ORGANISM="Porphyridium aerugineum, Strain SAG 1380-2" /LENGTH=289 /DNA_ID=CAMNT_0027158807 /DNA_START=28 /DNA_END=897 /DNA_ORIENTATION=-